MKNEGSAGPGGLGYVLTSACQGVAVGRHTTTPPITTSIRLLLLSLLTFERVHFTTAWSAFEIPNPNGKQDAGRVDHGAVCRYVIYGARVMLHADHLKPPIDKCF